MSKLYCTAILLLTLGCTPETQQEEPCQGAYSSLTGICVTVDEGIDLHTTTTYVEQVAVMTGSDLRGLTVHMTKDMDKITAWAVHSRCLGGATMPSRNETWATPKTLAHELTHWSVIRAGRFIEIPDHIDDKELMDYAHSPASGWLDQDQARLDWMEDNLPEEPFSDYEVRCNNESH